MTGSLDEGCVPLPADQFQLVEALRRATIEVSGGWGATSCDAQLRADLLDLYGSDPATVWACWMGPFLEDHALDLASLYLRHRRLPNPVLDEAEALMVLERLETVPRQLSDVWSRPAVELERLAQNWVVAV